MHRISNWCPHLLIFHTVCIINMYVSDTDTLFGYINIPTPEGEGGGGGEISLERGGAGWRCQVSRSIDVSECLLKKSQII